MATNNSILLLISFVLVLGLVKSSDFNKNELEMEESLWNLYERWRSHHNMAATSHHEKHTRFNVFKSNVQHVHNTNKINKPYKLRLNKFADMTNHEFRSVYVGSKISHHQMLKGERVDNKSSMYVNDDNVPALIDWRKENIVTPIKDQVQCGSCWAISIMVVVEGLNQIKTKKLVSQSEQELVDCYTGVNHE